MRRERKGNREGMEMATVRFAKLTKTEIIILEQIDNFGSMKWRQRSDYNKWTVDLETDRLILRLSSSEKREIAQNEESHTPFFDKRGSLSLF